MVTYLGSLFQLCCGEGGTLKTNITGMCGECSQCLGHTGFAPAHGVCAFLVYTAQAPGCSAGELSKAGPGLHALPRSKPLRFRFLGTPQRRFVPFPGQSSSGDQVLGECTLLVYTAQVPGCSARELSIVGPGFCVLARSKLLRFRFLGTPQRHRLSWACILCPSQVRGAQVTRCLVSILFQVYSASYHLPSPSCLISWVCCKRAISGVLCVSSAGLISNG